MQVQRRAAAWTLGVALVLALAALLVGVGLGYAAAHRYEGEMGTAFNSDDDDGPAVQLGLTVGVVGVAIAGAVGAFVRRTRSRLLWSVLAFGLVATIGVDWATGHGPGHRCSYDRYGNSESCVSEAGAVQRDLALFLVPAGLVLSVFWVVPRAGSRSVHRGVATPGTLP
jgi:hypothetical protein